MKIIKGGKVVSADAVRELDIGIDDGKIVEIAAHIEPKPGDELIDAGGDYVFPGFIDAHTHFDLDTGTAVTADDFLTGTRAALVGGTTAVIDFATQDRGMTLKEALKIWHEKADNQSSCHYAFHMAITDWNDAVKAELRDMVDAGVTSFKLYMAYDALRVDDDTLLDIAREMKAIEGLVGVHCENGTLVNKMIRDQLDMGHTEPFAHPLSRPVEVEAEAISRLLYISELADWPVCIVHLSSELGLSEIRKARAKGQQVIVETCPQYLTLTDELYSLPGFEGAKYVCSPPLRKHQDRRALREAMIAGEIDTIATDHCSFNFNGQKTLGKDAFNKIPNGLPGIEHRPEVFYTEFVHSGALSPERMCALLSENPAKQYGMYPQKGAIEIGSDADIVIWAQGERVICAENQLQHVDYTPYEGYISKGHARMVWLDGEICSMDGKIISPLRGRYIARGRPQIGR